MRGKRRAAFRAAGGLVTAAMVLYLTAVTAGAEQERTVRIAEGRIVGIRSHSVGA